jgi:exonuclease 3'-5' domain-containing protein 2
VVYPRLPSIRHSSSAAALSDAVATSMPMGRHDRVPPESEGPSHVPLEADFIIKHEAPSASPAAGPNAGVDTAQDAKVLNASEDSTRPGQNPGAKPETSPKEAPPTKGKLSEPPFTPLDFKIPSAAFHRAQSAPEENPESFFSYSLYRGPQEDQSKPDSPSQKVKVHYCRSAQTMERVLKQYFMDEPVVGFDLEWDPDAKPWHGPRRNISLVQLASPSRVALFHLALFPKNDELVTPSLRELLGNLDVRKVGVWVKGDAGRMKTYLGVESKGLFELSHLYNLVKFSTSKEYGRVNRRLVSLAKQVQAVLGLPMYKGSVRTSDWSKPLQMDQIMCKCRCTLKETN